MFRPRSGSLGRKGILLVVLGLLLTASVFAQTTAFTYQGRLTDGGSPANGSYDLEFKLFDMLSGGVQQGSTQTLSGVTVTSGVFTVQLDFGSSVFTTNAGKFLEIGVKNAGGPSFTTLPQRQPVNATPYAIQTLNAAAADSLSAACSGCVTDAKVANGISYAKLSGAPTSLPPSGAASGDLTGNYPNPVIAANAVTSAKIADGSITNADVSAAAAIFYSKLNLSGMLQGSDIAAGTFTTTNAHTAIGNNDNTARELRLLEPSGSGVNYSAFKSQAQAADLTYTLPSAAPTAVNDVLKVQAVAGNNATLTWGAPSTGLVNLSSLRFARTPVTATNGGSYTALATDEVVALDMSAMGNTNFDLFLPSANVVGKLIIIKIEKFPTNGNLPTVTIKRSGTDLVGGAVSENPFGNAGGVRRYYSDGAGNWYSW